MINAMLAAEDASEIGPEGGICKALDDAELMRIMARYRQIA